MKAPDEAPTPEVLRDSYLLPPSERTGLSYLSRTRSAAVVCYLDFDGVLHPDAVHWHPKRGVYFHPSVSATHELFEWTGHLEAALAPYPDVALVLSTSWVRVLGYTKARARLPSRLARRVIGATYHSNAHGQWAHLRQEFVEMARGEQVWADVTRRQPAQWFAIDDAVDDWPESLRAHLVPCESHLGLGDEAARRSLDGMLRRTHGTE